MTPCYYVMPFFVFVTVFPLKSTLFNISFATQHFFGGWAWNNFFPFFNSQLVCVIWNQCLLGSIGNFPDSSVGKMFASNAGDPSLIPELGRSPGEGIGYPLECSGLENSMNCMVHGVAKSRKRLSDFHFTLLQAAYTWVFFYSPLLTLSFGWRF